jgi:uncharacterized SAM-binding protein YcdF (DUF218 family)
MRHELMGWLAGALARPLGVGEAARSPRAAAAEAIIVLGAPLDGDGRLTDIGQERVNAAAELFRRGGGPRIVVSGGVTRGARRSEAAAMAEALAALGVPIAAVVVEARALTTADNARHSAALLRSRAGAHVRPSVWLVTQPFHERRARWWFRRVGFEPWIWHIEESLQYRDSARALRWSLREYLAWSKALALAASAALARSPGQRHSREGSSHDHL